jgi:hypothetical protein
VKIILPRKLLFTWGIEALAISNRLSIVEIIFYLGSGRKLLFT